MKIERLFYSETLEIQGAVYPKSAIRSNLLRLDIFIIQRTLSKLAQNQERIRNSSAYVKIVLFNSIMEVRSDLTVDPYLNFLNGKTSA